MDAWELKTILRNRINSLCDQFLPNGNRDGRYYRCAGVHGGNGTSCVIHLTKGSNWDIGDWYENSPSGLDKSKGSVLDLFMVANNISDTAEGFKKAKEWCGVASSNYHSRTTAQAPKVQLIEKKYQRWPVIEDSIVGEYLINERGIPLKILRKYSVCEAMVPWLNTSSSGDKWLNLPTIVFEFYSPDNKYMGAKFLAVQRDSKGNKRIRSEAGMTEDTQQLWGITKINPNSKSLVICEGEIDALSAASVGYEAVSIPFGAKGDNQSWIQNNFEWLDKFEDIKVCMDSDDAGKREATLMLPRLNVLRCSEVEIDDNHNDCNALYLDNPEYLISAIESAKDIAPEKLKRPNYYTKKIWNEFFPADGAEPGDALPFSCPSFRLRDSEVSVWTGYPKHGKTNMLNWIINNVAARYKRRIGIASLEIKPEKTLRNFMRQAIGQRKPTNIYDAPDVNLFNRAMNYLDNQFFVFDCVGRGKLHDILETFTWAVRKYGLDHIVIDSLMKLDVSKDDLQRQSEIMDELCNWARDNSVHVHLVAHSRKPQHKDNPENHMPRPDEVEGSGDITKQAHNTILCYRNKSKEVKLLKAEHKNDWEEYDKVKLYHDAVFWVRLQREGDGDEPIKHLHFDKESWQYGESYNFTPINLINIYEEQK